MQAVRLQWCSECGKDYRATQWRRTDIYYGAGVSGWRCPRGHETRLCDSPSIHHWVPSTTPGEVLMYYCTKCDAVWTRVPSGNIIRPA